MLKAVRVFCLLILGISLVGCGRDATEATATGHGPGLKIPTDACTLLDDDQIASLIGQAAVGEGENPTPSIHSCEWAVVHADEPEEVVLELHTASDAAAAADKMDTFRNLRELRSELDGLGDEAFLAGNGLDGVAVVARRGTLIVDLASTGEGHEAAVREAVRAILAELE